MFQVILSASVSNAVSGVYDIRGEVGKMGKEKYKKKQTASGKEQSISFEPLIICNVAVRQSKDVFNKQIQIIKAAFKSLTGGEGSIL